MSQLRLGVIGIGAFGARVALRLLWSGYHTLSIYDVADVATRVFTNDYGGMALGSPKMMAQTTDVVITVLPSAAELREVCFGWEGVAEGFAGAASCSISAPPIRWRPPNSPRARGPRHRPRRCARLRHPH